MRTVRPHRRPARVARSHVLAAMLACSLLPAAGCRSARPAGERTVTVRVENNLVPATALTISVVPSAGERRTIGTVPAGRSEELRFPVGTSADPHRFLAEAATNGSAIASRAFTLAESVRLDWNVGQNVLNVAERR